MILGFGAYIFLFLYIDLVFCLIHIRFFLRFSRSGSFMSLLFVHFEYFLH